MHPIIEPRTELIPDPAAIAALVAQLVEGTWPSSDEEREVLFQRLCFKSGERLDHGLEGSSTELFTLLTDMPGISFASWSSFHGLFMSVDFHFYPAAEPQALATRLGHDAVSDKLTDLYGRPIRPWGDEEVPPSIWKANSREIVTHLFTMRDSSLMLSVSDEELSVAAESEAAHETCNLGTIDPHQ